MMVLRNGLKRMRRTPLRTILFFLLVSFAAALLATGGGLWKLSRENVEYFESIFQTVATVEQRPERFVRTQRWDADDETYRTYNMAEYGDPIPLSVLDFEGAGYISGPEKRAWYAAYVPEYKLLEWNEGIGNIMVVEASPVEDGAPAGPLKMEIKRILYSYYQENAPAIYFCDHDNPHPEMMYADKTYIMCVGSGVPHGWPENPGHNEYNPYYVLSSTQAAPDGTRLESRLSGAVAAEVTPGFYQTEEGKAWLALVDECEKRCQSVPVTATQNTDLIQVFYDGDVYMEEGRGFEEQDYSEGRKVCLVPRKFARRNELQVGDSLHLPLRYANYADSANVAWEGILTASGEGWQVFEDGYWEICGIYDVSPSAGTKSRGYQLAYNEIIIPASSIENSDSDNIAASGQMEGYTTSFEIPNGTIEEWKELWEKQGVDGLEVTFYDKGYTRLEDGLIRMKKMAVILLVAGGVSALCVLLFFCHLFITKQSMRTAVERSLGMSRGQCAASLLSGILLIVVCGCIAGSVAGHVCTAGAVEQVTQVERFDRRYSAGAMGSADEETEYLMAGDWRVGAVTGTAMAVFAMLVALGMIHGSLKREPLALLSGREE